MNTKVLLITLLLATVVLPGCSVSTSLQDTFNDAKELVGFVKDASVSVTSEDGSHVVIVPGYGSPVIGNNGYEAYVDEVIEFVEDDSNGVDTLVFSGSYSTVQNESEAQSLNAYFNSAADLAAIQSAGIHVYKEECAILSWQNISYTETLLQDKDVTPTRVTIFGDEQRADKLKAFGTAVFNTDGTPENASDVFSTALNYVPVAFEPFDFNSAVEDERTSQAKFLAEIAGAYDPDIGNQIIKSRIAEWTAEFGYDVADNLVAKGCEQYAGFQ